MNKKHVLSVVLAFLAAGANALASQVPQYASLFNLVAGVLVAVQPYLAMSSPKAGQ